ncbi:DegT/DnrJ/EryC1/StrS family aminotransferase [Pseudomarimonas salicorniae]|uniref:DegT/DnrJ/EryC1/StrS family aminotransferase n=1 Tax=Pseudomarimonas salicorniae TaxID=2933270 RepID=A0ABT0GFM8_9GAMM|nr:DegT/DnrJ/EryC1/StrS family aminotransferase [Lysobacter sp. CAU 1642]MCK7592994.1 DegT/DnrJ/EryC1/StrS family aminotransferase [Lysobacter sp. CAU 1642]
MQAEIPLACPEYDEAEAEALLAVLRSRRWSVGPALRQFEDGMAALAGRAHGVGVSSGTMALQIALEALGIGPGDEVIVPAYTFVGPVNAILGAGAHPVLVDVDPVTLNIDPDSVDAVVGPNTRAIMPVHLFGRPAPMPALQVIAEGHRLRVVDDACEAAGARDESGPVGRHGDIACFAFYPNKPVSVGEGGMLVMDDPDLVLRARQLRNQGNDPLSGTAIVDRPGHSARLSEWHAALGMVQLKRLEASMARRERVAALYRERLQDDERFELPAPAAANQRIAWFTWPLRLAPRLADRRDGLIRALRAEGIGCNTYFTPVHHLPFHRGRHRHGALTVTENVGRRCLAVPLHSAMGEDEVDRVCGLLRELVECAS